MHGAVYFLFSGTLLGPQVLPNPGWIPAAINHGADVHPLLGNAVENGVGKPTRDHPVEIACHQGVDSAIVRQCINVRDERLDKISPGTGALAFIEPESVP